MFEKLFDALNKSFEKGKNIEENMIKMKENFEEKNNRYYLQ